MSGDTLVPVKEHISYLDQIQNLIDNGLAISDTTTVVDYLKQVNYYRLSGYMRFFKDGTGKFVSGATIEHIVRLYEFDRHLRQMVMGQLEVIEVLFRSKISYQLAESYGPIGYMDAVNFHNSDHHGEFVIELQKEIHRSRNVPFVAHHLLHYGGNLPIWVAVEVMSFGTLSKLYKNMKRSDQNPIANDFGVPYLYIESWLQHLCYVRNVCAHYSRIYGRLMSTSPKVYKKDIKNHFASQHQIKTFFSTLFVMKKIFLGDQKWRTFLSGLQAVVETYDDVINLAELGLDDNWFSKLN